MDLAAAAPVVVKPVGSAKYCLGIYSVVTNGATDATTYYPYVSFAAYVASGTYSGAGLSAATAGTASANAGLLPRKAAH